MELDTDLTASVFGGSFGYPSLLPGRGANAKPRCPVVGCSARLVATSSGRYCTSHGLRVHRDTFVYWNGYGEAQSRAKLRNVTVRPDLAEAVVLRSTAKAETDRLGHETSEDALTWNVFVALAQAGRLRDAVRWLAEVEPSREPDLYLWGERVDVGGGCKDFFAPLEAAHERFEPDILRFRTEPDIMISVPGELIVSVEAKFCSGNPLSRDLDEPFGEKPTSQNRLLKRYLGRAGASTRSAITIEGIRDPFHSQLFRNVVFAAEMAGGADWRVVNLVSSTQWGRAGGIDGYDFVDPTARIRAYLSEPTRFHFRTWERLHMDLVANVRELQVLDHYMRSKSAKLRQALVLGVPQP